MSKDKNKVFPKEREQKLKDANRSLKSQNKQLKKKIINLENEKRQIMNTFYRNMEHMEELADDYTLEEMLELAKKYKKVPKSNTRRNNKKREDVIRELKETYCNEDNKYDVD